MRLNDILTQAGAHKRKRRKGRGEGSGRGKTSGRGSKGAGARAGVKAFVGFEGGQNPLLARIPKRGFNNKNFRVAYQVVNLQDLEPFESGATVDLEALVKLNLVRAGNGPVKVLGDGALTKRLTVRAHAFSKSAEGKIAAAGGSIERLKLGA